MYTSSVLIGTVWLLVPLIDANSHVVVLNDINMSWSIATLKKKMKRKRKKKETQPIFKSSHLGNAWHGLVEIWNVEYQRWRASLQQKLSGLVKAAWSYVCVKIALLFFLSIYRTHGVAHAGFLGCTTHYHVFWCISFCTHMYIHVSTNVVYYQKT